MDAIGTKSKRVLEEKDLYDFDALQAADPADLVDEVEYEGYSGSEKTTKTAEIDQERAEAILFEVNSPEVVIEQGDGGTNVGHLQGPWRTYELPNLKFNATATLNAKDFS